MRRLDDNLLARSIEHRPLSGDQGLVRDLIHQTFSSILHLCLCEGEGEMGLWEVRGSGLP